MACEECYGKDELIQELVSKCKKQEDELKELEDYREYMTVDEPLIPYMKKIMKEHIGRVEKILEEKLVCINKNS